MNNNNTDFRKPRTRFGIAVVFTLAFSGGCATYNPTPPGGSDVESRAFVPPLTKTSSELRDLPAPSGIIAAAVYNFRDQTGQYKAAPSNALSTAVTQGADSILIDSMLDTGWFSVVERSSLQDLLTERKIRQSQLVESGAASGQVNTALPPVAPAQLIIEGAVVSFDSNVRTGGSGLRLLGIGASQQYREDRVTVNLRAINIDNGLILHSVTTTKRIFSREISGGVFAYVDDDAILEGEAGRTTNEPSHAAISEAIESSLIQLIGEGILANSWQLSDPNDLRSSVFERFLDPESVDAFVNTRVAQRAAWEEQQAKIALLQERLNRGRAAATSTAAEYAPILKRALRESRRESRLEAQS